jgi:hypothetical protein
MTCDLWHPRLMFVIVIAFSSWSVIKAIFEKALFVVVGVVEIYVLFPEWFNFMFIKKNVESVWLKIMVQFDIGNIIT